ncbi:MAG: PIN domain protein [Ignavibacteria bacterium]|nr:PIN domain protein [Ignavibacteria bacterium]
MKKQRIYIDTSVIGGCFDNEFEMWSNGLLKDFKNNLFIPVVSDIVEAEVADAPNIIVQKYHEFLDCDAEIIETTDEVILLADVYSSRKILKEKFYRDMLHIALATVNKIDILVSWNFKHIVRFDKIRLFNSVNIEQGYSQLEIYSPREITFYGKE